MKDLIYAVKPLVFDSLGVIVFAVLMALKVDLFIATAAGAGTAIAVVALELKRHGRVAPLQWISLAMVVLSSAATFYTHDPRYVMAKPSVVYAIVGAAMLRRGWMNRYVPPENLPVIGDLMTAAGFVWAGLMFATSAANLVIAILYPERWAAFIAIFPLASKIGLFAVHFGIVKVVGDQRMKRVATPETLSPAQ